MRHGFFSLLVTSALGLFYSPLANAGYIEIGGSANYRISSLDPDNYQKSISYTGSLSYYFWEMSALELSYTQGRQISSLKIDSTSNLTVTTADFVLVGLDLILTLGDKQSFLLPYIKGGGAYIEKRMKSQVDTFPEQSAPPAFGLVPSAGVGFKLRLTQGLSLKVGVDAWSSPQRKNERTVWDYAGRAGLSWMF